MVISKVLKKIILAVLIIFVSLFVIIALGFNASKISSSRVVKYSQVRVDKPLHLNDIINNYSEPENREKFVSEFKKINSIDSCQYISNKTLIIPIFKTN
ncbi:MAG: hypothetical protein R6U35_08045 [Candidatus Humimicrobiaceae bacterium]